MSNKSGNNLLLYFGLVCFATAIFCFFIFGEDAEFQFLNEMIAKNIRLVIVAVIGLIFTFFGVKGKIIAKLRDKKNAG